MILAYIIAGICVAAAIQERRDFVRAFGFLLFAAVIMLAAFMLRSAAGYTP